MEELLEKLTDEQMLVFKKIGYFGDDEVELEEALGEYIQLHCLTDDDGITEEGEICESILDLLSEIE
jgi:hypothetical protein